MATNGELPDIDPSASYAVRPPRKEYEPPKPSKKAEEELRASVERWKEDLERRERAAAQAASNNNHPLDNEPPDEKSTTPGPQSKA